MCQHIFNFQLELQVAGLPVNKQKLEVRSFQSLFPAVGIFEASLPC